MAGRLSRRQLAAYVAGQIIDGADPSVILKKLAAFLVEHRRTDEQDLIVRDIEAELAAKGIVIADIVSARPLSKEVKETLATLEGAKTLYLRETIDASVLGGVRIDVPGKRFDGTIRHKLTALKAKQL